MHVDEAPNTPLMRRMDAKAIERMSREGAAADPIEYETCLEDFILWLSYDVTPGDAVETVLDAFDGNPVPYLIADAALNSDWALVRTTDGGHVVWSKKEECLLPLVELWERSKALKIRDDSGAIETACRVWLQTLGVGMKEVLNGCIYMEM